MKKKFYIFIVLIILLSVISGCSKNPNANTDSKNTSDGLNIVVTTFPQYDWLKQIMGEKFDEASVTLLIDNGMDIHSFQPSADHIVAISSCDLFIYNGGISDNSIEKALQSNINDNRIVIDMIEALGSRARLEVIPEGVEHNHHHDADVDSEKDHEADNDHEAEEIDEHIWLSLNNAKILTQKIAEALIELDPKNEELYMNNYNSYAKSLDELNERYIEVVNNKNVDCLIFLDRFPFLYLCEDYGLSYIAAFSGCSAETEASFETVTMLGSKIDQLGLNNVITIENSDNKLANTVIGTTKNKNQNILTLNSIQSVTKDEIEKGITYYSIMEDNLKVIEKALEN